MSFRDAVPVIFLSFSIVVLSLLVGWHDHLIHGLSSDVSVLNSNGGSDRFYARSVQCANISLADMRSSTVVGSSMLPAIQPGETFYYIDYNSSRAVVDSDVVWTSDNVMHFVCGAYEKSFYTCPLNKGYDDQRAYHNYSDIVYVACGFQK